MHETSFVPTSLTQENTKSDNTEGILRVIAQWILVGTLGLVPVLFIPLVYSPVQFSKVSLVVVGLTLALIFYMLSVLRQGSISLSFPLALLALWGVVGASFASAILSGDVKDSLVGNSYEVHTTAFITVFALVVTALGMLNGAQRALTYLYGLIMTGGVVLFLYHLSRVVFGPEFLSFGTFSTLTATPFGAWNGLAIFAGLIIILALVACIQLPLGRIGRIALTGVILISLAMLVVVNFYLIWVLVGLVSGTVLLYTLAQKHFKQTLPLLKDAREGTLMTSLVSASVVLISLFFVLGTGTLAGLVSDYTGTSYIEVRPSFEATFAIARQVYDSSPLYGSGPNTFADLWQQHKNPAINTTIFWDSSFDSGGGYIPTAFTTTGILGVVSWALFFLLLILHGLKMVLRSEGTDPVWSFLGSTSFVATLYLAVVMTLYTPSAAVLLLAATCIGVFLVSCRMLIPHRELTLSVQSNRAFGAVLVCLVVLVIFSSIGGLYVTGRHYTALFSFNKALAEIVEGSSIDEVQAKILTAHSYSENDVFMRQIALYRLAQSNSLLQAQNPTDADVELFQQSVAEAVAAANEAVTLDASNVRNVVTLGQIYSMLVSVGVEGAYERARESLERATVLSPNDPSIVLALAQLESRNGNIEEARNLADRAVAMKGNYTDALAFLSQLDILENNISGAIARTLDIISIEPNNPARYYQLGVLQNANGNEEGAVRAFERAIVLDPEYANARYMLALLESERGNTDAALTHLTIVSALNPENEQVRTLIERLIAGESINAEDEIGVTTPLVDSTTVNAQALSETNLVVPVNGVADEEETTVPSE